MALTSLWRTAISAGADCSIITRKLQQRCCFSAGNLVIPSTISRLLSQSAGRMQQNASINVSSKFVQKPMATIVLLTTPVPAMFIKPLVRHFAVSVVTHGGGPRMFMIHPTAFTNRRWLTWTLFYMWLGIFMGGIPVLYLNLTEGHAELADIPPGYIPHEWEYFKKPFMRWLAHYAHTSEQRQYEVTVGGLESRKEELWGERRNGRVYEIMRERRDYHGWFTTQFTRLRYNEWLYDLANEYETEMRDPLMVTHTTRIQ